MVILLVEDKLAEARLTGEARREAGVPHALYVANGVRLYLEVRRKRWMQVLAEILRHSVLCRIPVIAVSNSHDRGNISVPETRWEPAEEV